MVSVGGQRPGLPGIPPLTAPTQPHLATAPNGRNENEQSLSLSGTLLVFDELDSLFILILLYNNRS